MKFPDKTFVRSYILMKYRPYAIKHAKFYVWGKASHNSPFKIAVEYIKMFVLINFTGSSNGRTADFDSANLGSSPSPVANQSEDQKP